MSNEMKDVSPENSPRNSSTMSRNSTRLKRRGSSDKRDEGKTKQHLIVGSSSGFGKLSQLQNGPVQYMQEYLGTMSSQHPNTLQNLNSEYRQSVRGSPEQREYLKGVRIVNPTKDKLHSFLNQYPRLTCAYFILDLSKLDGGVDSRSRIYGGLRKMEKNWLASLQVLAEECPDLHSLFIRIEPTKIEIPEANIIYWISLAQDKFSKPLWSRLRHFGVQVSTRLSQKSRSTFQPFLALVMDHLFHLQTLNVDGIYLNGDYDRFNIYLNKLNELKIVKLSGVRGHFLYLSQFLEVMIVKDVGSRRIRFLDQRSEDVMYNHSALHTIKFETRLEWFDALTSISVPECRFLWIECFDMDDDHDFEPELIVPRCEHWILNNVGHYLQYLGFFFQAERPEEISILTRAFLDRARASPELRCLYIKCTPWATQLNILLEYVRSLGVVNSNGLERSDVNPNLQSISVDMDFTLEYWMGELRNPSRDMEYYDFTDLDNFSDPGVGEDDQNHLQQIRQITTTLNIPLYISPRIYLPSINSSNPYGSVRYIDPEFDNYLSRYKTKENKICNIH